MTVDYELSFCIPTYNRVDSVRRLVLDILFCKDPNIEVVVLDNGSTDNTLEVLGAIRDDRLKIYSNGVNKGALFNMVNVLDKGRGEYLVYCTDQDYVDKEKIEEFKSFLISNDSISCGYCEFVSDVNSKSQIFPIGLQSIENIAYTGRHPTGYFFKNKLLKKVEIVKRFSDYEFVDLFPLEFVFAELSLVGKGAIYKKPIFSPESGPMVVAHKSSTTKGNDKKAFFRPDARLKLAKNYSKHLKALDLIPAEKIQLAANVLISEIRASTMGYKAIMSNTNLCIHYNMNPRSISSIELMMIALSFYFKFISNFYKTYDKKISNVVILNVYVVKKILSKVYKKL
jgi:glycosyltransferase involved in cell wall biosynthesis